MKTKSLLTGVFLLVPLSLLAANKVTRVQRIQYLIENLKDASYHALLLSNSLTRVHTGRPLQLRDRSSLKIDIRRLRKDSLAIDTNYKNLADSLDISEKKEMNEYWQTYFQNYRSMMWRVRQLLKTPEKEPVYYPEIDFNQRAVSAFTGILDNFVQQLKHLIPVQPDHLFDNINARLNQTDLANSTQIAAATTQTMQELATQLAPLKNDAETAAVNTKKILQKLNTDTTGKQYFFIAAYQNTFFGLGYMHKLGTATPNGTISMIGAEYVITTFTTGPKQLAAFGYYALRRGDILAQAGIGILKNNHTAENISWKGGILYVPAKVGIGLSYSPLTGTGILLAIKW